MSSRDETPDLHFHSGTNQPGRLEALARLGEPAGLTVGEASVGVRDWLLNVGPSYRMRLFVDTGAFSEFRGKPEPDWDDVMTFGLQLAKAYGRNVFLVAPDKVGDPVESFRRLKAYGPGVKRWMSVGAKVLIPIQRGADASAYMRSAAKAIGCEERKLTPAFPMMEKAWEPEDVISAVRKMKPREIHVLGRGPKRAGMSQLILALRAASPGLTLTTDSCTWASITPKGRPYALAGGRVDLSPLTHAAGWVDFDLGELHGNYNEFLTQADRNAMLPLTGGADRLLWLLDPDAWISIHGLNQWMIQEIENRWTLDPRMRSTVISLQALAGEDHDHEIKASLAEGHLVTQDDGRPLTFDQLRKKLKPAFKNLGLAEIQDQDERLREELDKLVSQHRFKHARGSVKLSAFIDALAGRRKLGRMSLDAALSKAGSRSQTYAPEDLLKLGKRGLCGEWAVALHQVYGYDIRAIYEREYGGLLHAYCAHGRKGFVVHADGVEKKSEMISRVHGKGRDIPQTADDLDALSMEGLDKEFMSQVISLIKAHPQHYGPLAKIGSPSVQSHFTLTMSPLEYSSARQVQRLQLVDPAAPRPPRDLTYFQPVSKKSRGRKISIPGSDPHVVAFADFSEDSDGSIFLHFFTTREDLQGQGLGRRLIAELYNRFTEAPEINWGNIVSAGSEKIWKQRRQVSTGPRTRGKLF